MSSPNGVGSDAPPTNATPGSSGSFSSLTRLSPTSTSYRPPSARSSTPRPRSMSSRRRSPDDWPGSPMRWIDSGTTPTSASTRS